MFTEQGSSTDSQRCSDGVMGNWWECLLVRCGLFLLAWLGVPGHRYRVTRSRVHKGFKGQSQGAH